VVLYNQAKGFTLGRKSLILNIPVDTFVDKSAQGDDVGVEGRYVCHV
jgi:hypothetical protein